MTIPSPRREATALLSAIMAASASAATEKGWAATTAMTRLSRQGATGMAAVMAIWAMTACPASAASAPEPSALSERAVIEFYRGRAMTMISGYTPEGGDRQQERAFSGMTITSSLKARAGDDLHGRLLARHMGRHIPGEPRFIVQTLPGAGGRRARDYLALQAAQDGSVIGNVAQGLAIEPLLFPATRAGTQDVARLQWLGSLRGETGFVIAWTAGGDVTTDDLFQRGLLVGGTTPLDDSVVLARALNALIGTRFKLISGYSSTMDLVIAMERGETAGFLAGSGEIKSRLVPWRQTGQARALLQLGQQKDGAFADVPMALDYARTAADRETLNVLFARQALGAPYAAPGNVPAERLAALRRAFEATMSDDEFLSEALRLEIAVQPLTSQAIEDMLAQLAATPAALRDRVARLIDVATGATLKPR